MRYSCDSASSFAFSAGSSLSSTAATLALSCSGLLAPSSGVNGPFGLALSPDGTLSVSGSFSNDVVSVDLTSLAVSPLVAARAGGLGNAMDLAWDGATLLAVSPLSNAVVYFDASGDPTGVAARGLSASRMGRPTTM